MPASTKAPQRPYGTKEDVSDSPDLLSTPQEDQHDHPLGIWQYYQRWTCNRCHKEMCSSGSKVCVRCEIDSHIVPEASKNYDRTVDVILKNLSVQAECMMNMKPERGSTCKQADDCCCALCLAERMRRRFESFPNLHVWAKHIKFVLQECDSFVRARLRECFDNPTEQVILEELQNHLRNDDRFLQCIVEYATHEIKHTWQWNVAKIIQGKLEDVPEKLRGPAEQARYSGGTDGWDEALSSVYSDSVNVTAAANPAQRALGTYFSVGDRDVRQTMYKCACGFRSGTGYCPCMEAATFSESSDDESGDSEHHQSGSKRKSDSIAKDEDSETTKIEGTAVDDTPSPSDSTSEDEEDDDGSHFAYACTRCNQHPTNGFSQVCTLCKSALGVLNGRPID